MVGMVYIEADRGFIEAKAELGQPIKLTNNVTVDHNDVQIRFDQLTFVKELGKGNDTFYNSSTLKKKSVIYSCNFFFFFSFLQKSKKYQNV